MSEKMINFISGVCTFLTVSFLGIFLLLSNVFDYDKLVKTYSNDSSDSSEIINETNSEVDISTEIEDSIADFSSNDSIIDNIKKEETEISDEKKEANLSPLDEIAINTINDSQYVIFKEGSRDNRIEMSAFNATSITKIIWDRKLYGLNIVNDCTHYYYDETSDKFVEFEKYDTLSDYATEIISSNINVYDNKNNLIFTSKGYKTQNKYGNIDFYKIAQSDSGQSYWIIYNEGSRNNRLEMASFNANDNSDVIWNRKLYCEGQKGDCIQYYFDYDKNKFIEFGTYNTLSDYASNVVYGNVNIYDSSGNLIEKSK